MHRKVVLSFAILLCLTAGAQAALTIVVGAHNLNPNQAGQTINIYITAAGGEQMNGVDFRAQEGDGGTGAGGSDIVPLMTVDILGPGTIFETNNTGQNGTSAPPGFVEATTTTAAGNQTLSTGDNLLAVLTFDTTGFTSGNWALIVGQTVGGPTDTAGGEPLTITDGSITIVPEPSSVVLGLFAIAGFGAVAIRRRRAR